MLTNQFMCVLRCGDHTSGCSHICLTDGPGIFLIAGPPCRPGLFLLAGPLCRLVQVDLVSF